MYKRVERVVRRTYGLKYTDFRIRIEQLLQQRRILCIQCEYYIFYDMSASPTERQTIGIVPSDSVLTENRTIMVWKVFFAVFNTSQTLARNKVNAPRQDDSWPVEFYDTWGSVKGTNGHPSATLYSIHGWQLIFSLFVFVRLVWRILICWF